MATITDPNDLLTAFERSTLSGPYKEYASAKRNNLFASIQLFRPIWDCCMLANDIWLRGFRDMDNLSSTTQMIPLSLYMNAHAKMLVTIELGFSGCISEAHSILRDAIESVAHAHRMLINPGLQTVWLQRNDGNAGRDGFKHEFIDAKKDRLFAGLPVLHRLWRQFSDWGSHTSMNSILMRFQIQETPTHIQYRMNYTGAEQEDWTKILLVMLDTFAAMEELFYSDFRSRLTLDHELSALRTSFDQAKEAERRRIIAKYNISAAAHG